MANVQTNTKDDSIRHVWNFPWLACLRVGFWCRCTWFGFLGPSWFDRTTNQAQLCGYWKRVSLWDFFPLWSSWSLFRCLQTHKTKLVDAKIGRLREEDQHYPNHWSLFQIAGASDSCEGKQRVSTFYHGSELCFQGLKQSDRINQERENRLTSILHLKRWLLILLNCAKLKSVSYTSNLMDQMYGFRKYTMFHLTWILCPQDLLHSRSLETVPACSVWQHYLWKWSFSWAKNNKQSVWRCGLRRRKANTDTD